MGSVVATRPWTRISLAQSRGGFDQTLPDATQPPVVNRSLRVVPEPTLRSDRGRRVVRAAKRSSAKPGLYSASTSFSDVSTQAWPSAQSAPQGLCRIRMSIGNHVQQEVRAA